MHDVIKLLPDAVSNQIAAGEVIQRPASVVKELLENSIDAGATEITLIIKNAGKSLIQVTDNGVGMSETDARMSFERHATSKITLAKDLFSIHTLGFRGEALASIAAIAHVELKTRREEDELGTRIIIHGSKLKEQNVCQVNKGTHFVIKNLFYNVPARRKFLKSDTTENSHILDEFQKVALSYPDVSFTYYNNEKLVLQLHAASFKERVINIFGSHLTDMLLPVNQETEQVKITGYVGKPEKAKKRRGEQYFFVNRRFFKHPYFYHAVQQAYQDLIPDNSYPSYFINFEVKPEELDVNIHPTKTEVNFSENRLIYAVLRSAVKRAIGKFSLMPSLDFDRDKNIDIPPLPKGDAIKVPRIQVKKDYNPFEQKPEKFRHKDMTRAGWEQLLEKKQENPKEKTVLPLIDEEFTEKKGFMVQVLDAFIMTPVKSGLMFIDQHLAHQRVLYEKYLKAADKQKSHTQKLLFPETVLLSSQEAEVLVQIKNDLMKIGFELEEMGAKTFVFNGLPFDMGERDLKEVIEKLIENYILQESVYDIDQYTKIAFSMAKSTAIPQGKALLEEEINALVKDLFLCEMPQTSPGGEAIIKIMTAEEMKAMIQS